MPKILLIDDSSTSRSMLSDILNKYNIDVLEAIDGIDGIEVLKNNKDIDLMIVDVNMPRMDGLTMIEKVKNDKIISESIPILMLTTESGTKLKERGKKAGVKAWITKPFRGEKMIIVINKILEKN